MQKLFKADKFYRPRLSPEQIISRSGLFASYFATGDLPQFIIFEAQAGQGKTTTAVQLLEQRTSPSIWFQVEEEDADPISFVSSLFHIFVQTLSKCNFDPVLARIENVQAGILELPNLLNLFLEDLENCFLGGDELILVFDDLHKVMQSRLTMDLLSQLLDRIPPGLTVVLLSRYPLVFQSKRIRSGESVLHLGNADLAMTRDEIVELLKRLLGRLPDPANINRIVRQSAGWPMGIVLATKHPRGETREWDPQTTARNYFTQELFSSFSEKEKRTILKLALLDEIPLELGRLLCPDDDVNSLLNRLAQQNFFLSYLNDAGTHFGFHQYFLSFLRESALSALSEEEQLGLRRTAAQYYLENGMISKAMGLYAAAGDYGSLEVCFARYGLNLVAHNRYVTIGSILTALPEKSILSSAWFSYFLGTVLQGNKPLESLPLYENARNMFRERCEKRNELLVLAAIIYLYIIHSQELPRYQVTPLLEDADSLYREVSHELPPYYRIITANHIALGYLYFINNFPQALHYNKRVENLVTNENFPNLLVESRSASAWAYSMQGDRKKGIKIIEENYRLIRRKELGLLSRIHLYFLQIDYLRFLALRDNFLQQRDELIASVTLDFLKTSFVYPFLVLYDLELAFSLGKFEQFEEVIESHKDMFRQGNPGVFRGEFFCWQGLYSAVQGGDDGVLAESINELEKWLEFGASPFHQSKALLLLANIRRLQKEYEKGLSSCNQAIKLCEKVGLKQQLARAYFHRALVHEDMRETDKAVADAVSGIRLCREKLGYCHVYAFTPGMFMRVIDLGTRGGEKDFSRQYAWHLLRMSNSDGRNLPALEIQVLGGFSLSVRDKKERVLISELSRNQRRLFGLLLQAPAFEISQVEVQNILWPDIPEEKARSRFDTMMSRLRKLLADLTAPHKISDYLVVRKGIISLQHCTVDAREFCDLVKQGLLHLNRGEWWQASNNFFLSLKLWQGEVISGMLEMDNFSSIVHDPVKLLISMAEKWSPVLVRLDRYEEAMQVCETAWRICNENAHLTRLLYDLYLKDGVVGEARKVIEAHRSKSKALGLSESEVEISVHSIVRAEAQ